MNKFSCLAVMGFILVTGCARFDPVSPENGTICREKVNISVILTLNPGTIDFKNKNGIGATVKVLRWSDELNDYAPLVDPVWLAGYPNGNVTRAASFGYGDEILIGFTIDGQQVTVYDKFKIEKE